MLSAAPAEKLEPDKIGSTTTPVSPLTESTGASALFKVTTVVAPALSVITSVLSAAPAEKLEPDKNR